MKRILLGAAAALLVASTAMAQQPDETATRAARQLGNEGIDLYEGGDYASALDRLERAYGVLQVPTLGLWYARALAQNGKLVEASERFLEVARSTPAEDDPSVFAEARQQATTEHEALQSRIPTVQITLEGADASAVEVAVDGKVLATTLIGVPVSLNPGTRSITATRGSEAVTETVTLKEGDRESVVLRLAAGASTEAAPETTPDPGSGATTAVEPDRGGVSQRTWGYVALGIGGAGLLTGTVSHFAAKGKQRDLEDVCQDEACPTSTQSDIDSYNTLKSVAKVGVVIGAVGVAAGTVLLITAPKKEPKAASVSAFIGLGSAGVRGVF